MSAQQVQKMETMTAVPYKREFAETDELSFSIGIANLWGRSWPLMLIGILLGLSRWVISMILGQKDSTLLAITGQGQLLSMLLSQNLLLGLASSYSIFGAQSFGKGDYDMVSVYMYRAWLCIQLIGLPTYLLACVAPSILSFIGMKTTIAAEAWEYTMHNSVLTVLVITYTLLSEFVTVQGITRSLLAINFVSSAVTPGIVYLFVSVSGLNHLAYLYAVTLGWIFKVSITIIYIRWSPSFSNTLVPITKAAFTGWGSFIKIASMTSLVTYLEGCPYLLVMLFTSTLDKKDQAAHYALREVYIYLALLFLGWSSAVSTLIGNALGERRPRTAHMYAKLAICGLLVGMALLLPTLLLTRRWLASLLLNDAVEQALFVKWVPFLAIEVLCDLSQAVLSSILIATVKQSYIVVVNLVSGFVIMIPLAYYLVCISNWGIPGVWISLISAYSISLIAFAYKLGLEDWQQAALDAFARIQRDKQELAESRGDHLVSKPQTSLAELNE